METFDTIVIGGGPAGLSAGIYLARFNRAVLIIDHSKSRLNHHQINENYLGFPKGISAKKLLELGVKQALKFGVKIEDDEIIKVKKTKSGFTITGRKKTFKSKTIVFASGVKDRYPAFNGIEKYIGKSLFWCIICDGYKVRNATVAVIGHEDASIQTCLELLNFTKNIVLLTNCEKDGDHISERGLKKLKDSKIEIKYGSIVKVKGRAGRIESILLDTDEVVKTQFMFNKQGYIPRSDLAAKLGVVIEGEGFIKVDLGQKTSIDGVYAAGDVTHSSAHQILTAAHQGSVAAVTINQDLLLPHQKLN